MYAKEKSQFLGHQDKMGKGENPNVCAARLTLTSMLFSLVQKSNEKSKPSSINIGILVLPHSCVKHEKCRERGLGPLFFFFVKLHQTTWCCDTMQFDVH